MDLLCWCCTFLSAFVSPPPFLPFLPSRPWLIMPKTSCIYAMPAIPGNVTIMLQRKLYLCSHYAQLCNGILPLTQGLGQTTCCKLADYGCMHCHAAINPSTCENLPLCIMQFLDNYIYFGYLKGANEVNRLQQAVLLCLLKALYYAGICSYAACIILCQKLCWNNSLTPTALRPTLLVFT